MDYSYIGNKSSELALRKVQKDVESLYKFDIFSFPVLETLIESQESFILDWAEQKAAFENEAEKLEEQNSQGHLTEDEYNQKYLDLVKREKEAKLETAIAWLDEREFFKKPPSSFSSYKDHLGDFISNYLGN